MDSTTALPYGSPFPDSDPPMSNTSSSPSILALSNPPPRSVWNTSTSVRGKSSVANAPNTRLASRARPAEWPVMPLFARSMSRHTYAHAHVRQVTGQVGARPVAVELAVEDVREPGLVGPRLVRFGRSARVRARHAPPFHDVDDAPSGGGDAPPLQHGLDLPGAAALMAVGACQVVCVWGVFYK